MMVPRLGHVRALLVDTGGTLLDWHSGAVSALSKIGEETGMRGDWPALTKSWHRLSTAMVNDGLPSDGGKAWMNMDGALAETLEIVLTASGINGFSLGDRQRLAAAWRELGAWSDVQRGLERLRRRSSSRLSPF